MEGYLWKDNYDLTGIDFQPTHWNQNSHQFGIQLQSINQDAFSHISGASLPAKMAAACKDKARIALGRYRGD